MKMQFITAAALLLASASLAAADECPVAEIEKALSGPLEDTAMTEREVSDIQSTEGGVWRIHRAEDGRVAGILRIDGGESGMSERRLGIVSANAYGIAVTRVDYLRHAFIDGGGPNGTAKRMTEYFYFCGGKLVVPPAEYATMDVDAYAKAGEEARKAMVLDKDVAEFTKGLAR